MDESMPGWITQGGFIAVIGFLLYAVAKLLARDIITKPTFEDKVQEMVDRLAEKEREMTERLEEKDRQLEAMERDRDLYRRETFRLVGIANETADIALQATRAARERKR